MYNDKGLVAWIDISTYCNAACPQCHRTNNNGLGKVDWLPLVQWSLEAFKQAFTPADMTKIKKFEICGTWGDPCMNKDFVEIVEYIVNNSAAYIQVNTNGGTRDEMWWWKLGCIGKGRLEIYFDIEGINQEMHSRYRQKVDFEKLKDNIKAYVDSGARANAHIIVFKHNEDYLYDILHMIDHELGIKGDVIFQASNRFHNDGKTWFTKPDGSKEYVEEMTQKDHPLLKDVVPIRDREWWEKHGKKSKSTWGGLWAPEWTIAKKFDGK